MKGIIMGPESVRAIRGNNDARKVRIDPDVVREAYRAGHTISEIAAMAGCSVEPIKRVMREAGIPRRIAKPRRGIMGRENNPAWRGGARVRPDGYIEIRRDGVAILEHRAVIEEKLGRRLFSSEVVHHVDGNRGNNHPDNLQVMSQSQHVREHLSQMITARWGK